eukprot:evm.model.scf_158.8 EVM.evm.TU.scf_158.8   scf_158:94407-100607(-)
MRPSLSVSEALAEMQSAVKRGDWPAARLAGASSSIPLAVPAAEVRFDSKLSSGAQGDVLAGDWAGTPVAVKRPRIRSSPDLDRFRNELAILASLSHPNVIRPIGGRALPPDYFAILPREGPSLAEMIHGERRWAPAWDDVAAVGVALAGALEHVARAGVVHRDVKPGNALWRGEPGRVVLVDFGIAERKGGVEHGGGRERGERRSVRGKPSGGFHKGRMVGTLEYMAPEVLQSQSHSTASDVYAFAIMLNEVATGVYPFSDCCKANPDIHTVLEMGYGRQELAVAVAAEGLRPSLPKGGMPPGYAELMRACWNVDPGSRPTFPEVCKALNSIQRLVTQRENVMYCDVGPLGRVKDLSAGCVDIPRLESDRSSNVSRLATARCSSHELRSSDTRVLRERGAALGEICGAPAVSEGACSATGPIVVGGYLPTVVAGAYASAGHRGEDRMEDRYCITEQFMGFREASLLGVFDGHRGHEAAEFAASSLPATLVQCLASECAPERGLSSAFAAVERGFASSGDASISTTNSTRFPGCTALAALLWGRLLVLANAGDCRAVLCRNGVPVQCTIDHTANNDAERARLVAAGATVSWRVDGWRVGKAGMQVARSIGDEDLKPFGVTAEPEVSVVELGADDEFLIMATDGFWDTVTNDEAIGLVYDTVKNPQMSAQRLATESIARGSHDNVTVIVAFLRPVSTVERVYGPGQARAGPSIRCPRGVGMTADEVRDTY